MTVRDNVCFSMKSLAELEGSRVNFAKKIGVSKQTVNNWVNGSNAPDIETIATIANIYGMPMSDILEGRVKQHTERGYPREWVEVPLYGSIAAGTPIEMMKVEDTHPIPSVIHSRYPRAFLLKVEGSSMDRILPNGCYALVNPCKTVNDDGKPYAICVNGFDATIKRVRKLNNGFELAPDSTDPTYKPTVYDYGIEGTEEITVIGRVVYYVLPFDWDF